MKPKKEQVIEVLKTILDPEVHIDIWTMGLIYDITPLEDGVKIKMTYTTPFCPWGPELNDHIETSLKETLKIKNVEIELTFDPPYKMPEGLRETLGI